MGAVIKPIIVGRKLITNIFVLNKFEFKMHHWFQIYAKVNPFGTAVIL